MAFKYVLTVMFLSASSQLCSSDDHKLSVPQSHLDLIKLVNLISYLRSCTCSISELACNNVALTKHAHANNHNTNYQTVMTKTVEQWKDDWLYYPSA